MEVGSFSDNILFGANEVMKQRLTVSTLYYDSNFVFDGAPLTLIPDTTGSTFRFAAPQTMERKLYYITWLKSGDVNQVFYAKIAKLPVYVIKSGLLRTITVGTTLWAYKADSANIGKSIPLDISTSYPPYEEVFIDIVVSNTPAATAAKITLNVTQIELQRLDELKQYYITNIASDWDYVTDSITGVVSPASIILSYSLSGTDSSSYQLSTSTETITVLETDLTPVTFVSLVVNSNTLTYVELLVKTNK